MKIYISADIEGVAGIAHWNEANRSHSDHNEFAQQMTQEVLAACRGAQAAGATEIVIKDAHASGRNIQASDLPECAQLIRGWSGHPFSMVQELDQSYDALIFIGYHSPAGSEANPLAHTMNTHIDTIMLNGQLCSEFLIFAYAAELVDVPVALVSGDQGLKEHVTQFNSHIRTLALNQGIGDSVRSIHPKFALKQIEAETEMALKEDLQVKRLSLPKAFKIEVRYKNPVLAYQYQFYPGAKHVGNKTICFETDDYFEVLRFFSFVA